MNRSSYFTFFVLLQERQTECLLKNNLYTKATLHLALADVILRGKSAILAAHAKDPELTIETSTSFQTSYLQGVYIGRQYSLRTLDIAHPLVYFSCLSAY